MDLDEHFERIHQLMWPNLIILGGGVSKNADKYLPRLTVRCPIVPAELRNDAGIIGAAIVAAETVETESVAADSDAAEGITTESVATESASADGPGT